MLACYYLTQHALHSTSYIIIISELLLYVNSKGITRNHKTRLLIHNNNTHHATNYIIIISELLLYVNSKGITHNHKTRLLIHNNNTRHSTSYIIIISVLSLYVYSKGITQNHKTRFLIHNNNTQQSKAILLKKDTKVNKKEISQLEFFSFNRCSSTLLSASPTAILSNEYLRCSCHTATVCELNNNFLYLLISFL